MNTQEALNVLNLQGELSEAIIKKAYKKLALKYHPDRNPLGEELMKAVNAAFEFLMRNIALVNKYQSPKSEDRYNYGEELEKVLTALSVMPGIVFEVIGNWVWIDGETKANRAALRDIGCFWAYKKKKWYYRPEEHKSAWNRREHTLEEIREKYGSRGMRTGTGLKGVAA
ncbi:DnaJ domain-containing protein [Aeromonas veronii]